MHLLSTKPGGYVEDGGQGIVRIEQTPGDIVVLSAADTVLSMLADAAAALPEGFPSVRLANLMWLRQPASMDLYVDDVLAQARVVIIDHLGSPADWAYVVEQAGALARQRGQWLALFSGDNTEDPQLLLRSTAHVDDCRFLWRCLREGGRSNAQAFFALIGHRVWGLGAMPPAPQPMPPVLPHAPAQPLPWLPDAPAALLLFYRAHVLSGNTAVFDAIMSALHARGINPLALAVDSLKSPGSLRAVQALAQQHRVDVVLNTTSFAIGSLDEAADEGPGDTPLLAGDAPVLQLITVGCAQEQWQDDPHGLAPRDLAMQVVLPEVDGRICTRPVSFKGMAWHCDKTQVDVVRYQPDSERIAFVAELAWRWCVLRRKPPAQQRLALILANYPNDDARLANGVGLDTPASTVRILQALQTQGYHVQDAPANSDELMARLTTGITNDLDANDWRPAGQSLAMADYLADFAALPAPLQDAVNTLWGLPAQDPMVRSNRFMIAGLRLGQVFVGIQPARGRDLDLVASYHDADLVPTHAYLAFYFWLRRVWALDAVVHVGKHGNLEWLPGKSVALGATCWPDVILGPLPHLYPFIVNDPGEGSQAKRRTQAVIIDHLMPPLARAESYGPLRELERQMDEYYEALALDPRRAERLRQSMLEQILANSLHLDLGFDAPADEAGRQKLLQRLDAYLCEIKESQIRDGLHILGQSPQGRQRTETLVALARFPRGAAPQHMSLLRALADDLGLQGFDPLEPDWNQPWNGPRPSELLAQGNEPWRHAGHTRERLERLAAYWIERIEQAELPDARRWPRTASVLEHVRTVLAKRLDACGEQEITQLLRGLQGRWVPPGPSGAPSRGRPDVLPTGRNFYSVDTRAVPSPTAYAMGQQAAERLLERHLQDHGRWPQSVGLSVWGTSTMRTAGEDMAQALALMGARPKWAQGSNRVVDVEILPMSVFNRPRVDVTLRISGFFRDAFPNLIHLFDAAVQAIAAIPADEEPDELNPIRVRVQQDRAADMAQGLGEAEAHRQATWRVFGPRLGGYGAGLQELIDSSRWNDAHDLAQAYLRAGAFAYGQDQHGAAARAPFERQLGRLEAVIHNQDNREHDILDSDDYYQFHGGMAAAVAHVRGEQAALYHGDFSVPGAVRIRTLSEELARVVRARVVNPKWIAGVKRHGYKGAFEMAATVDYLFAFDATTGLIGSHQYALVADAYVHDADTRRFLEQHNPQALRSIGERLLEAVRRGLWQEPGQHPERIRQTLLELEHRLETGTE